MPLAAEEALLTRSADFDYDLPAERIAQEPLPERDSSRLLVLDRARGAIRHHVFRDLPDLLTPGDLVVNRSRVFPARLLGRTAAGGAAEVLLVRSRGTDVWEALVHPGRRLRSGSPRDQVDAGFESSTVGERGSGRPPPRSPRGVRRATATAIRATATHRYPPTWDGPTVPTTATATRPSTLGRKEAWPHRQPAFTSRKPSSVG